MPLIRGLGWFFLYYAYKFESMKQLKYLVVLAIAFVFNLNHTYAQATYGQDVSGSPLKASRYVDINGSPFLIDTWQKGVVQLNNGQTYKLDIKYDLIADDLMFKDKNGDSLTFVLPVKELKLNYTENNKEQMHLFRSGYPAVASNSGPQTLYEVLAEGAWTLLKKQTKSIWEETTTYGTANRTKNISTKTLYYIYNGKSMAVFRPQKKALLAVLPEKAKEIDQYIKDNHLDVTKDVDLVKVFENLNGVGGNK
jgi:hypothetical protein